MCFSAGASFGASVVLTVIGVSSLKKVQQPAQLIFASIPLIFAAQQITEGFIWLALLHPGYAFMVQALTHIFLLIAQVIWPVWVPLGIWLLEKEATRKKILLAFLVTGILISVYISYCLVVYHVQASIIGYHVSYEQGYLVGFRRYGGILYIIATVIPPFFSSIKKMWLIGVATIISYAVTVIFYENYITSVWCFFASIISLSVFAIMRKIKIPSRAW